jgi:general secretion pathway protein G
VLPRFLARQKDAQVGAARTQIATFKTALQTYQVDNGDAPSTQQGLQALVTEPTSSPRPRNWKGPYLSDVTSIPKDPWGNDYHYEAPGPSGTDFEIISYGADGRPGGSSYDADLSSAQGQGDK